jgi:hypothetical protein
MAMAISTAMSREAMLRGVGTALMVFMGMGCAGAQQRPAVNEQSSAMAEEKAEPVGAARECVDEQDRPVSCLSDSDCCKGFVCGRDPELNPRASYCIFGG